MKTSALMLTAGLVLASSCAQAGPTYTTPEPPSSEGTWEWFAGGSVGYLTDLEDQMYTLHLGAEYKKPNCRGSHSIYLEVAYAQDEDDFSSTPPPGMAGGKTVKAAIDLDIIPITLNYKYEAPLTDNLHWYLGIGAGIAILDSSYDWSWTQAVAPPNHQGSGNQDTDDVQFYGHVFSGITYEISDSFEIFAGVRYLFMDEQDVKITTLPSLPYYAAGIDGDVLVELGIRYNF